ncbi:MAG: gamma-glutamyltranspeptidase/glutathione hydrolase [Candidatus Pelagisphaera sp.]|jgi:gamma-glutamyltranspeptidase/glutathione hydrolase
MSLFKIILVALTVASSIAVRANQAAVAMPDSFSAEAAAQILKEGGNAVDAAIAAQFVLTVTLPEAGNIGGGGFMLIHKDGNNDFLDYREVAPLKAHRDMYLDANGDVISNISLFGILSSGVPGTVAGMWQAHQKYATKPWSKLVQPAIDLAAKGFIPHPILVRNVRNKINKLEEQNIDANFADTFSSLDSGIRFKQPELAATLRRIAKDGPDGFYKGVTAQHIVEFMEKTGGIISHKDLSKYEAKWRRPIVDQWREYQVVTSSPPSSGGIAVLQWLKMYQQLQDGNETLPHNSKEYIHLLSEIGKRVFADRAEHLGDPDFINVPISDLIADSYIAKRSQKVSLDTISVTEDVGPGLYESEETTHFSILDQWGNAVSNTTTLNLSFGSAMVVEGAGFLLNGEMDDFSIKAGVANVFGALGGKANEIQPGKRMLSSMTPTMLLKDGEPVLITGSPGGTTIITSVYQSILNVVEYGMSAREAVDDPRFHHQLWPKNEIRFHTGIDSQVTDSLKEMGYTMKQSLFGDLQLITHFGEIEAASQSGRRGRSIVISVSH